jgi:enamine deaminase RidA (YjgF/YER057c/UK114 family)
MPRVETFTPPNTPTPIGPYSRVAKVGSLDAMNRAFVAALGDHRPARTVFSVKELPRPGVLLTMNLTAVTKE